MIFPFCNSPEKYLLRLVQFHWTQCRRTTFRLEFYDGSDFKYRSRRRYGVHGSDMRKKWKRTFDLTKHEVLDVMDIAIVDLCGTFDVKIETYVIILKGQLLYAFFSFGSAKTTSIFRCERL